MNKQRSVRIGNHMIGYEHPVFIVAEISGNHNQDYDRAVQLIRAAAESGADAVKLQTYTPDTITLDCDNEYFRAGETILYSLYSENSTPWEWQPKLKAEANNLGLELFSSPFDPSAVDFLSDMDIPAFKIASFELVDIPLIRYAAAQGTPLIMSTGMATLSEIEEAVNAARSEGCDEIVLLKCTSSYPAVPAEMNLRTIPHLSDAFSIPVGLSDHTQGISVPVAAVSIGAVMVEKHFTISRSDGGAESGFALEPDEFREMVQAIRTIEDALGTVHYGLTKKEKNSRKFRRSLFAVKDIEAGDVITSENVRSIRPGYGLEPGDIESILGKRARLFIGRGTPISMDQIGQD